ncbi:hypothetical protein [Microbacterium sp. SL75]|nr:hypothetical protein [Microbacterium sp. SL75]WAC70439.1 hypothetical protein OVA17_07010 [Microbacterium sp. SL75]
MDADFATLEAALPHATLEAALLHALLDLHPADGHVSALRHLRAALRR